MEYGRFVETKNGWKTFSLVGSFVIPKPKSGLSEKPVMIHDVIVSGTFLVNDILSLLMD